MRGKDRRDKDSFDNKMCSLEGCLCKTTVYLLSPSLRPCSGGFDGLSWCLLHKQVHTSKWASLRHVPLCVMRCVQISLLSHAGQYVFPVSFVRAARVGSQRYVTVSRIPLPAISRAGNESRPLTTSRAFYVYKQTRYCFTL